MLVPKNESALGVLGVDRLLRFLRFLQLLQFCVHATDDYEDVIGDGTFEVCRDNFQAYEEFERCAHGT